MQKYIEKREEKSRQTSRNEKLMYVQVSNVFPEIEFNFSKWCKVWIKASLSPISEEGRSWLTVIIICGPKKESKAFQYIPTSVLNLF